MDLYQFHSPTLVGSSVGIIRILYIIYISRIRGIFTWYIMMHLSLIVYVYFNLYVIVQNIGFVKQRPDGLFHGFHSFHTSVCLRPVVKTGVECSGVYTCTHTEGISSGGLSSNLQCGTRSISARSTSTRLWIFVVGGVGFREDQHFGTCSHVL